METNILLEHDPLPVLYGFYANGAASPNPGHASWAFVVVDLVTGAFVKEYSGFLHYSTHNRAELYGVIRALESDEARKADRILVTTASRYVKLGITEWLNRWILQGWRRQDAVAKNADLWQILFEAVAGRDIEWAWTRSHAGDVWNKRCGELCREVLEHG